MIGIKIARTRAGITQQALAKKLKVTDRTVRSWELGESHPGMRLSEIAESLGCRIREIVDPDPDVIAEFLSSPQPGGDGVRDESGTVDEKEVIDA